LSNENLFAAFAACQNVTKYDNGLSQAKNNDIATTQINEANGSLFIPLRRLRVVPRAM
jgi:hypothetical protein